MQIRVGHSPDPDDAFMFWALTTDLVDPRGFAFEQVLADIQTLNQWARAARLEVTAISLAAYPFVQEDYALLPHGASIGTGYGPIVVGREPATVDDLRGKEIVVPGAMTTAFLTLRLVLGDLPYRELPFEQIPDEVASGPGRLRPAHPRGPADVRRRRPAQGARPRRVVAARDGAAAAARRQRRAPRHRAPRRPLAACSREAIHCGLENRDEALEYALQFGRGIDEAVADRFIEMYVNELTQDYGDEGRAAVAELLRRGEAIGAFPQSRAAGLRLDRRRRGVRLSPDASHRGRHSSVNTISCAPSQRKLLPSARRFSLPSTIVAKWFPASAPALEAKLT